MIFKTLVVLIIILIIGYLFTLIIINLIDKKLKNINLTLPQQEIIIKYPENNIEKFENNNNIEHNKNVILDENYYNNMNKNNLINGFSNHEETFKSWDINEKKTQVCYKNHHHNKSPDCTYGVTNFLDPKDMSPVDYKIFVLNYPKNMTLQDYINWLYCYINKEDQLPYNHLKNLEKLKLGIELKEEEGVLPPPGYYYPPMNSDDYFNKMYNETNEYNIAFPLNSVTGPMLAYNYNDYPNLVQNNDLYGNSGLLRNNDIPYKKNAKKLYNYIFPKDSNSLNIDNDYEKYRIKNVEV
jgi:hypothetical protein